jgi:spore coat polysaccharide biosynthesis protein SpsF
MILALIQARFSSTRLPGKVLRPILGKPMLLHQLERVRAARMPDRVAVATSRDRSDDPVAFLCEEAGFPCFRGDLEDVLDRFYRAAEALGPAEQVIRLTGDCPLADPAVIDAVAERHLAEGNDYTSNVMPPTFPDGLDVEILRLEALKRAWREAELPSQREHVTPYVNRHPNLFRIGNLANGEDLSALRWTVDEPEDFEFVSRIYGELYPTNPRFGMGDVLELLAREPEWASVNRRFLRNEGMAKSLERDREILEGRAEGMSAGPRTVDR